MFQLVNHSHLQIQKLKDLVRRFANEPIAVLGDPMCDFYHHGEVRRVSQEAPVPVFTETRWEVRPGGAANVEKNLKALGCNTRPLWEEINVDHWTQKHRYLVGTHQCFRIDRDADHRDLKLTDHQVAMALDGAHAAVISDYGRGTCSERNCSMLIQEAQRRRIPVVVDPKGAAWGKYQGATVICPNHLEYSETHRTSVDDSELVIKRAADGIDLIRSYSNELLNFPARARRVYDVTGAGDTVTAVLAAVLAARGTLEDACELANLAAGLAVAEVGTAAVSAEALIEEIDR